MKAFIAAVIFIFLVALPQAAQPPYISGAGATVTGTSATFSFTYNMGDTGPLMMGCRIVKGGATLGTIDGAEDGIPATITLTVPGGTWQWSVSCSGGGQSASAGPYDITVGGGDAVKITGFSPNPYTATDTAVSGQVEITGPDTNCDYSLDTTPLGGMSYVLRTGSNDFSFPLSPRPSAGSHNFGVQCVNGLSDSKQFSVDAVPSVKIMSLSPNPIGGTDTSFGGQIAVSGADATCNYLIDNAYYGGQSYLLPVGTNDYTVQLSPRPSAGTRTFKVDCNDGRSDSMQFTLSNPANPSLTLSPADYAKFSTSEIVKVGYKYDANGGPSTVKCILTFGGDQLGSHEIESGSTDEITIGALSPETYTWQVSCEDGNSNPVVSSSAYHVIVAAQPAAAVVLDSPSDREVLASTTVSLSYHYNANGNPAKSTSCNVILDGLIVNSNQPASDGSSPTPTTVKGLSENIEHWWQVVCGQGAGDAVSGSEVKSPIRHFTIRLAKGSGGNNDGGTGTGSGTGTGTGAGTGSTGGSTSGGGNIIKKNDSKPPLANNTPVPQKPSEPATPYATLSAPSEAYLNTSVTVAIVGDDGRPLRGVAISVKKPNGAVLRIVTGGTGSARYYADGIGPWAYRAAGYNLRGSLQTKILEPPVVNARPADTTPWLQYALIFGGLVVVLAIAFGAYSFLTKKPEQ